MGEFEFESLGSRLLKIEQEKVKSLEKEIEILKYAFKGADKICNDYAIKNHRLEKELGEYRAAAALNSSGVNLYKENQEMKQVIKSVVNFLESASRTMENVNIPFLIEYIENLEKTMKSFTKNL